MKPTFISLFSGIGGFDLGLERAGFECIAQCDNDPFCNKVLAKHWPGVKRYDDVRAIGVSSEAIRREQQRGANAESAGLRQEPCELGMEHRRVDLICGGFPCQDLSVAGKRAGLDGARSGLWFEFHRILSELRPTFALIENVPGLLSSNQGRDFGIVLAGLGELWPAVGWAVLDSQHFGVAQRRRRVYVIAGPSRECIQQILSLCESGDWNTQARRAAGEDVAASAGDGFAHSLSNVCGGNDFGANKGTLAYIPDVAWALQERDSKGPDSDTKEGHLLVAHSLRADGFDASEDGTGRGTPLVTHTLSTRHGTTEDGSGHGTPLTPTATGVRRLTPVECERLQGFPDGWTQLDDKTPDGPRYKALGNAVTVPVIEYIGLRISEVLA